LIKLRRIKMVRAFVLVNIEASKHYEAFNKIKEIEGVKEAHIVTGLHDVILLAESNSIKELGELIVKNIQSVPGVSRTVTCIAVD